MLDRSLDHIFRKDVKVPNFEELFATEPRGDAITTVSHTINTLSLRDSKFHEGGDAVFSKIILSDQTK